MSFQIRLFPIKRLKVLIGRACKKARDGGRRVLQSDHDAAFHLALIPVGPTARSRL